jgi:murein DD-endopeptidase MepM/ murein hydrolase activator NlpD
VEEGDTLAVLAERYGSTVPAIVAANRLANPDAIVAGQTLVIPAASTPVVPVEVRPGDTLDTIARRQGTTAEVLRLLNGMGPEERVVAGQDLLVVPDPALPSPALPQGPVQHLEVVPARVPQGSTVLVDLKARQPVSISVSLGDQSVPLRPWTGSPGTGDGDGQRLWGLAAVPALAEPGLEWLAVRWESGEERGELRWPFTVVDAGFPTFDIELPPGKGDLLDPELVRAEAEKMAAIWASPETAQAWKGRYRRPIAEEWPTSAPFGQRRSYNGGPVNSYHAGQDFSALEGTPVVAPAAGTVVLAEPLVVRGNAVVIDHGAGQFTGYWHLSQLVATPGQAVKPGDLIGLVGTTGLSTGNHLHWEMRLHGVAVDPLQWVGQVFP